MARPVQGLLYLYVVSSQPLRLDGEVLQLVSTRKQIDRKMSGTSPAKSGQPVRATAALSTKLSFKILPQPSQFIPQYLTECYVMGKQYNNYDYNDGDGGDIFTVFVHDLFDSFRLHIIAPNGRDYLLMN